MDAPTPEFVAQAVKYYTAVLESKKKAWKVKNPNPRPRGRPKKVKVAADPPAKPVWEDCGLCNEGVYYMGEGDEAPCPFCVAPYEK